MAKEPLASAFAVSITRPFEVSSAVQGAAQRPATTASPEGSTRTMSNAPLRSSASGLAVAPAFA